MDFRKAFRTARKLYRAWERHKAEREAPRGGYFVYAYYNQDGRALYVGRTSRHPLTRGVEHLAEKPWVRLTNQLEWVEYDSHKQMVDAEKQAIRDLNPVYNKIRYGG